MKFYNVLFLGLFFTVPLSSMEDNSNTFKVIQGRLKQQVRELARKPENNDLDGEQIQKKLQFLDRQVNVLQAIREAKIKNLSDALKAYSQKAREAKERRKVIMDSKLREGEVSKREVSDDDEDYNDFV